VKAATVLRSIRKVECRSMDEAILESISLLEIIAEFVEEGVSFRSDSLEKIYNAIDLVSDVYDAEFGI